jgi:hypothetical protein
MATLYCLAFQTNTEIEDLAFTLNLEKALEWLKKNPTTRQIIEYSISEDSITRTCSGFWHYSSDGTLHHDLE